MSESNTTNNNEKSSMLNIAYDMTKTYVFGNMYVLSAVIVIVLIIIYYVYYYIYSDSGEKTD
jgi:hypothetical protein